MPQAGISTSAPTQSFMNRALRQQQQDQWQLTQQQEDCEIQPYTDEDAGKHGQRAARITAGMSRAGGLQGAGTAGLPPQGSQAMPIPGSSSSSKDWGSRTYRVRVSSSPSPSTAGSAPLSSVVAATAAAAAANDQITVVLEPGQTDAPQLPSASTSQQTPRGFLGSLFQRTSRDRTPEGSTHGADLLPHHYRPSPGSEAVLGAVTQSLEASSVLSRACGSLRRQGTPAASRVWDTGNVKATSPMASNSLTRRPSGIRAFASVGNLSALQSGVLIPQRPPHSTAPSPRVGEPRYPHIQHLLQSQSMGTSTPPARPHRSTQDTAAAAGPPATFSSSTHDNAGRRIKASLSKSQQHLYSAPQYLTRSSSLVALLQYESGDPYMSSADIAVLSSSLPTNFAQPARGTLKRVGSISSPTALSRTGSSTALALAPARMQSLGGSSAALAELQRTPRNSMRGAGGIEGTELPPALPICLICLEMLTPEDFASGEAMQLDCMCKGEVAMRHRACAIEWSNVKGNLLCDICKHPINNLPEIDPAIVAAREAARQRRQPAFAVTQEPTMADYVFDAIRVTWVTIICCILFVDGLSVSKTFLIGTSVGMVYMWLSFLLQYLFTRWRHRQRQAALRRQQQQQQQQAAAAANPSTAGIRSASGSSLMQPLLIPGADQGLELPV